jgi:hypothetical protein
MEYRSGHVERRGDAYRRAADVHRRAERLEPDAVLFFNALGGANAASRHARNAARQRELADADDARAAASDQTAR